MVPSTLAVQTTAITMVPTGMQSVNQVAKLKALLAICYTTKMAKLSIRALCWFGLMSLRII
ncbi:hypothetical protein D3C80_2112780 [compost metagenome]